MQYIIHISGDLVEFDQNGGVRFTGTHPFHSWSVLHTKTDNGYIAIVTGDQALPSQMNFDGVTVFPSNKMRWLSPLADKHAQHFEAFGVKKGASFLDALTALHAVHRHPGIDPDHA
ncbi:MAG: hypothetical protein JWO85_2577 [Candidatus Eremiobacteraeota bacterium]|nr:hypothetical protein [Candidatus Eremiobacteraeota bacterium]